MSWRDISQWIWAPALTLIPIGVLWKTRWSGALMDFGVALSTSALVSLAFFGATDDAEDARAQRADRSENRRVVMDASGTDGPHLYNNFDLRGQHLNGVELPGVRFNEADLTEATLYQAELPGVDFIDARLICATLRDADLADTPENLGIGPDLRRAELQGADLRGVQFGTADLQRAVFGDPGYEEGSLPTDIRDADLSQVENPELAHWNAVIYDIDDPDDPDDEYTKWPAGFDPPESAPVPDEERSWPLCTPSKYSLE
jgi:uncharacterized protein YjbI with pentapeptide repeats